jgi:hypothetical protein
VIWISDGHIGDDNISDDTIRDVMTMPAKPYVGDD